MSLAARRPLNSPRADLANLTDRLGCAWGISKGEPLIQYLAWSDRTGLFRAFASRPRSLAEIVFETGLNVAGADVLTCILLAVGLLRRERGGRLSLTDSAREYFLPDSPYYVGNAMFLGYEGEVPPAFCDGDASIENRDGSEASNAWSTPLRLMIQHARNFAPCVVAARSGEFDGVRHLVDIGGGSGVLAIPLALDHPEIRITLVERTEVLEYIGPFLDRHGIRERITLLGMNALDPTWNLPSCDGVFFGNVFHAHDDAECVRLARCSFDILEPGGRVWVHEVLFDRNRDGPLVAALWNANMFLRRHGARQRTEFEIARSLREAGFTDCRRVSTASNYSLVVGVKTE